MIGELWCVEMGGSEVVKGCWQRLEMVRRKEYRGGEEEIEVGLKEYG